MYLGVVIIFLILVLFSLKKNNDKFMDKNQTVCIKGILALFIFIHHIAFELDDLPFFLVPIQFMAFFVVGTFFFLSGYGLMSGLLSKKEEFMKSFFKKRLLGLLFPYLVCLIVFALYNIFYLGCFNFLDFIQDVIFARTIAPLWYMTVMFSLYILFYIIFNKVEYKLGTKLFFFGSLIYIMVLSYISVPGQWCASIIGFWFGLYFKMNEKKICAFLERKYYFKLIGLFLLFVVLFVGRLFISLKGFDLELFHGPVRNIIVIVFLLLLISILLKINIKSFIFEKLGLISYEIYLIHPFIISLFKGSLSYNSVSILLLIFVTMGLSLLLFYLKKICLRK